MRIESVYSHVTPWGSVLTWRWLPSVCKGGMFGPGSFHGKGRQHYILRIGCWRIEFSL